MEATHYHNPKSQLTSALRRHWLALLLFPLLAALYLHEVLFQDKSLSAFDIILSYSSWNSEFPYQGMHQSILSDSPTAHYPERKLNWDLFRQGHNFNYTPYIFSGTNYVGRKIGAFITSLPQLFMSVPEAIDWSTMIRLTLAGFFMYLLLVHLGLNRPFAILGGLLWSYNMHQIVWLEFPQHLATQLWMPLLLMVNLKLLRSWCRLDLVLALLLLNLLFYTSGYTQIVLYFYVFIGLFNTFYIGTDQSRDWPSRFRQWLGIHSIYIAAMAFLVADILMEAFDIQGGLRGAQAFRGESSELHLDWLILWNVLNNSIPDMIELKRFWAPLYDPEHFGNIVESGAYYGVIGLFLSCYSITGHGRHQDKRLYYVLLVLFFLLVAFYNRDPLVLALFKLIPLGRFGYFGRMITVLLFLLCIFAALGLKYLTQDLRDGRYGKIVRAVTVFLLLPVLGRLLDADFYFRGFLPSYVVFALFLLFLLAAKWELGRKLLASGVIVLVTADLFRVTYDFNTRLDNAQIFPENRVIRFLLNDPSVFRVAVTATTPIYHHNILTYYKIPTVGGYLTVAPTDYIDFIGKTYGDHHLTANGILFLFDGRYDVLRHLNVKYIISDHLIESDDVRLVHVNNNNYVYQLVDHLERVYCASDYIHSEGRSEALSVYKDAIEKYDRPVVTSAEHDGARRLTAACRVDQLEVFIDKLRFQVDTEQDSFVVVPYNFSPNWRLEIDGAEAPVFRANSQLMTVSVQKGTHQIELVYVNDLEIASAALLIVVALIVSALLIFAVPWSSGSLAMLLVCLAMIWKNAFSLPGVKNHDIPEKPRRGDVRVADTVGLQCVLQGGRAIAVQAEKPFRAEIRSPLDGLRRVELWLELPPEATGDASALIVVREKRSQQRYEKQIALKDLRGKQAVSISLGQLQDSRDSALQLQIEQLGAGPSAVGVWQDSKGLPCVTTYHDPEVEY